MDGVLSVFYAVLLVI